MFYDNLQDIDPGDIVTLQFELGDINIALGNYQDAQTILNPAFSKRPAIISASAWELEHP